MEYPSIYEVIGVFEAQGRGIVIVCSESNDFPVGQKIVARLFKNQEIVESKVVLVQEWMRRHEKGEAVESVCFVSSNLNLEKCKSVSKVQILSLA